VLVALSVVGAVGCASSDASDEASDGSAETTAAASPTTATTEATSTSGTAPSNTATSSTEATGQGQRAELFPSVATFGITFDSLNTDLVEQFDYHRIDITVGTSKLPDPGQAGAFATEPDAEVLLGGWVEADGAVSTAAILSPFRSGASLSAVLTLMAVTIESTQENLDAVSQALQDIDAAGVGGLEYLVLDGRGVLFEAVEIDGEAFFWAMVTGDADAEDAAAASGALRQAVIDQRDR